MEERRIVRLDNRPPSSFLILDYTVVFKSISIKWSSRYRMLSETPLNIGFYVYSEFKVFKQFGVDQT